LLNPHLISVSGFLIFSFLIKSDLVIDSDSSLFFLCLSVILISAFGFSLFVINSNRDGRLLLLFSEK
jgi:phosphoglycerol transferase MdoB-like AlkP superfamily enzyme